MSNLTYTVKVDDGYETVLEIAFRSKDDLTISSGNGNYIYHGANSTKEDLLKEIDRHIKNAETRHKNLILNLENSRRLIAKDSFFEDIVKLLEVDPPYKPTSETPEV